MVRSCGVWGSHIGGENVCRIVFPASRSIGLDNSPIRASADSIFFSELLKSIDMPSSMVDGVSGLDHSISARAEYQRYGKYRERLWCGQSLPSLFLIPVRERAFLALNCVEVGHRSCTRCEQSAKSYVTGACRVHTRVRARAPSGRFATFRHCTVIIGRANAGKTTIMQKVCETRKDQ
jgi:hypothetical protein